MRKEGDKKNERAFALGEWRGRSPLYAFKSMGERESLLC